MTTLAELLKAAALELKKKSGVSAEEAQAMIAAAIGPVQQQAADNSTKIADLVTKLREIIADEVGDDEKTASIEAAITEFANEFVAVAPPAPEPSPEPAPESVPEPAADSVA